MITTGKHAGFCFGVRRAVDMAFACVEKGPCYTLGPLIHNTQVVRILEQRGAHTANAPEDIIPLLPYIYCCHAKLFHMSDDFEETMVPYRELLTILKEHNWDGYLLSEYEGNDKYDAGYEVGQTLRKQHIMMKNILGD